MNASGPENYNSWTIVSEASRSSRFEASTFVADAAGSSSLTLRFTGDGLLKDPHFPLHVGDEVVLGAAWNAPNWQEVKRENRLVVADSDLFVGVQPDHDVVSRRARKLFSL